MYKKAATYEQCLQQDISYFRKLFNKKMKPQKINLLTEILYP